MLKISCFVLFVALATINLTLAQSNSNSDGSSSGSNPGSTGHQHANFFGFPLPFDIPQLPFFREQREADAPADAPAQNEEDHEGNQDRFFFSLFSPSTFVSCNSTTQAGATCLTCTQALRCGGNNVGRLQQCRGFHPYCNVGRCSFFPGELCNQQTNSTG